MTVYAVDCVLGMQLYLADDSIDAIVTDPPYELGFMGKAWDNTGIANDVAMWRQAFRVLKAGGHLLAFGGTRTYHRMVCAIEDAGFEIRDQIGWLYGSGFPKSLDVSKAIDKAAGAEREIIGSYKATGTARTLTGGNYGGGGDNVQVRDRIFQTAPSTDAARQWEGWGTALKPAWEPIVLARKPLIGTVAANVLAHGTGALNIDGCRVEHVTVDDGSLATNPHLRGHINGGNGGNIIAHETERRVVEPHALGRWPANIIHDGSDEVIAAFPQASGAQGNVRGTEPSRTGDDGTACYGKFNGRVAQAVRGDTGSAARFFYCAKASKRDRGPDNTHPTVKPTDLMRYLCRLVTPPGGLVLDPFSGSGSTGRAAKLEGFRFIGFEKSEAYAAIANARIAAA